ncbi:hypothetical protein ACJ73_08947 [Blastomyces percursus]|uniref:Kinesin light chain n=1 Tax=Blastomyces percursus TaxID=1658174 RepID=A0A1J9PH68_9EURO|nr:hypothetical protein ACJ73_08947 [Blastomyces percursus]
MPCVAWRSCWFYTMDLSGVLKKSLAYSIPLSVGTTIPSLARYPASENPKPEGIASPESRRLRRGAGAVSSMRGQLRQSARGEQPIRLDVMMQVAKLHHQRGEWDEVLKLYNTSIELYLQHLGTGHDDTLYLLGLAGSLKEDMGDHQGACEAYRLRKGTKRSTALQAPISFVNYGDFKRFMCGLVEVRILGVLSGRFQMVLRVLVNLDRGSWWNIGSWESV